MESIRKQASKLREQVAKQQQAVLKRLGSLSNEAGMIDEAELLCHQKLHDLYNSTRATKHFQRSIVRGVEAFVSVSSKQMEIGGNSFPTFLHLVPSTSVVDKFHLNNLVRKLAEDCCKYGSEKESSSSVLPRASFYFGTSHNLIEEERATFINILSEQVAEPLRAQIAGAPLEDARHLTHRYDKLHQELESQVAEVFRRQLKSRDSVSAESSLKLQNAESRLKELKSTTVALGREATAAMLSVEDEQQQITFHKLRTMVDAERSYHQHALVILDKLHSEMILEKPPNELSSQSEIIDPDTNSNRYDDRGQVNQDGAFFIARAIHPFDAQADGELNLSVDDYVVVRQVGTNGWSEGECNGKAGWFPSAYVEARERAPLGKLM